MLLKRIYNIEAPAEQWLGRRSPCATCRAKGVVITADLSGVEPCATCHGAKEVVDTVPPLAHVELRHTGTTAGQNFSGGLVEAALREGWMTVSPGKITLHVQPEELVYSITRMPGRYCCHCAEKLPDDATGELARAHVGGLHAGVPSPDAQHPAGYCMLNHYECVLDATQHERWKAPRGGR